MSITCTKTFSSYTELPSYKNLTTSSVTLKRKYFILINTFFICQFWGLRLRLWNSYRFRLFRFSGNFLSGRTTRLSLTSRSETKIEHLLVYSQRRVLLDIIPYFSFRSELSIFGTERKVNYACSRYDLSTMYYLTIIVSHFPTAEPCVLRTKCLHQPCGNLGSGTMTEFFCPSLVSIVDSIPTGLPLYQLQIINNYY